MTFINLLGEREALTANSEQYKAKITNFMRKQGYVLVADSSVEGRFADLIFARPEVDGKTETWVEAKYEELSLSNKKFISELGKYYASYLSMNPESRFKFFMFIKRCKNLNVWKNIFDPAKEKLKEIERLFEKVIEFSQGDIAEKIRKSGMDAFLEFIRDTRIYQGNYDSLCLKIDQIERQKEDLYQPSILDETSYLKDRPEFLTGNLLPVVRFPKWLWITHGTKLGWREKAKLQWHGCCAVRSNKVYSISSPNSYRGKSRFLSLSEWTKIPWDECLLEENARIDIVKELIKQFVISKGRKVGCMFDAETNSLFFVHENTHDRTQKKFGRQVSRAYWKNSRQLYFVEHRSTKVYVKFLGGRFYVVLKPWRLFTKDGLVVIRGQRAKELHYNFPPKFEFNHVSLGWLKYWKEILKLDVRALDEENVFMISDFGKVEINCTSEDGMKFDDTQPSLDEIYGWGVSQC